MERKEHGIQSFGSIIEQGYSLGEVKSFQELPNAGQNKGYNITTTQGVYFIREYRKNISIATSTLEAPLLEALTNRGLPVPEVVRNKKGGFLSRTPNGNLFILEKFIDSDFQPSDATDINEKQRLNAAKALATFHKVMQDDPPGLDTPANITDYTPDRFFSVEKARAIWEIALTKINEKSTIDDIDMRILAVSPQKLASIDQLDESALNERMSTMPSILAHGDFTPQNVLFQGDDVAGIVDWELARKQPRIWELMRAVCSFCKQDRTEFFNTPVDKNQAEMFINMYNSINPLTDAELRSMFTLPYVASLYPHYILSTRYIHGRDYADKFFPLKANYWTWWEDNADNISANLCISGSSS